MVRHRVLNAALSTGFFRNVSHDYQMISLFKGTYNRLGTRVVFR